jgi:transposase
VCNAHHPRELLAVIEEHAHKQAWAVQIDPLLRALHEKVKAAKAAGEDWLDPLLLTGYRAAYQQIIAAGNEHCPLSTVKTGKRGVIRQTPARNLLTRLEHDREQILRFAHDFRIAFDNNLLERDIRMIKIQQKISGSWRTTTGADRFLALRAYISTTRNNGREVLDAPAGLAEHQPWLPTAANA